MLSPQDCRLVVLRNLRYAFFLPFRINWNMLPQSLKYGGFLLLFMNLLTNIFIVKQEPILQTP